jgi:hypothetical protein
MSFLIPALRGRVFLVIIARLVFSPGVRTRHGGRRASYKLRNKEKFSRHLPYSTVNRSVFEPMDLSRFIA